MALSSAAPLDDEDAAFFREQTGLAITEIYGSTETGGMAIRSYGANHGSWEPFACIDWKILSDHLCVRSAFVSPDLPRDSRGVLHDGGPRCRGRGKPFHAARDGRITSSRSPASGWIWRRSGRRSGGFRALTDAYVTAVPLKRARQAEIAALVVSDLPARTLRAAIRSMDESAGRPRRIRIVGTIPILPNGKIDRERVDQLLRRNCPIREDQGD